MLSLGVLDQSPVRSGGNVADALHETLDLAELCDRLGYRRYWLAEHHSSKGLAGTSPEVLIGQVAARTSRIRVGSGGVMLSHYSALKVAEQRPAHRVGARRWRHPRYLSVPAADRRRGRVAQRSTARGSSVRWRPCN